MQVVKDDTWSHLDRYTILGNKKEIFLELLKVLSPAQYKKVYQIFSLRDLDACRVTLREGSKEVSLAFYVKTYHPDFGESLALQVDITMGPRGKVTYATGPLDYLML